MTRDECKAELIRLGQGWQVDLTRQQVDAVYGRIEHVAPAIWRDAVDMLLVNFLQAPRSGFLDHVLRAVDQAQGEVRRRTVHLHDRQAKATLGGWITPHQCSDEERTYGEFRLALLRRAVEAWADAQRWTRLRDGAEVRLMGRETARIHSEGLAEWLQDDAHARWAASVQQGDCGQHTKPHTLLACLVDEQRVWAEVVAGRTVGEAKALMAIQTGCPNRKSEISVRDAGG
jgi:hypothetical protein